MTARRCIAGKIRSGKIDPGRGRRYLEALDQLEKQAGDTLSVREAAAAAAGDLARLLKAEQKLEKRRLALKILAVDRAERAMRDHPKGAYAGAKSLLVRDDRAPWINVEDQRKALLARAHAMFAQGLDAYRSTAAGLKRDKAGPRQMVRELFGEATGNQAAKEIAEAWGRTAEWLRQRFNRAGGDIAERKDWRLPQRLDSVAVGKDGADVFASFMAQHLDRQAMRDAATGAPLTDLQLKRLLADVHEEIRTDGWSARRPGAQSGPGALANRHGKARTLVYKDAAAWLAVQDRYGGGDVFQTLVRHIDDMAGDLAMLEVLGPNPAHLHRYLQDRVQASAAKAGGAKLLDTARLEARHLQYLYDDLSGAISTPVSARIALVGSEIRAGLVAAQLGGAFLSALGDTWTHGVTRAFNGLPVMGVLRDYLRFMDPRRGGDAMRLRAVQMGLAAEGWTRVAGAAGRLAGETFTGGTMARVADTVMRASLLQPFTAAGQWAFGLEFLGQLGRNAGKRLDELTPRLRAALERHGIDAAAWDTARAAPLRLVDGVPYLHIEDIARQGTAGDAAAMALLRMIHAERDMAVIQPGAETRAWLRHARMGGQAGSLGGEVGRLIGQYKGYGVTVITAHWRRALAHASIQGGASYAAVLFAGLTVMGMLAMQSKQLGRGKEPLSMDPATDEGRKAWGAAMLQGGGFGILGDFLFKQQSRFDKTLAATLAGPTFGGLVPDALSLTIGNALEAAQGKKPRIAPEAIAFAGRYTPGSSLWYSRLALERVVLDQLTLLADRDAPARWARMEAKTRKETGQDFWWRPGHVSPSR